MAFNRADSVKKVLDSVGAIKPTDLFISVDGPRIGNSDDEAKISAVQKVFESIDWPCNVRRNYRAQNMGSAPHIIDAINWFFSNVETGIILEDDCVPDQTFYSFVDSLLTKYADDSRIMAINGSCLVGNDETGSSYRFSKYFLSWGWASWRRSWKLFENKVTDSANLIDSLAKDGDIHLSTKEITFWKKFMAGFESGKYPFWDGRWLYTIWKNHGVCITPNKNLILNVGFTADATHTFSKDKRIPTTTDQIKEILHPTSKTINDPKDLQLFEKFYYRNIWQKISFRIKLQLFKIIKKTSV